MNPNESAQSRIEGLATLLVLDEEIRRLATIREFGFFSTNETHRLVPYHTGYLWQSKEFIGTHLVAQSGTAELDLHAPANQWLIAKINKLRHHPQAKAIRQINFDPNQPNEADPSEALEWPEALPYHFLWCPLLNKSNNISGGLIYFRETPFTENEIKMISWLIASYQYTWQILVKAPGLSYLQKIREKPVSMAIGFVILVILFFPIHLAVFGTGTIVAKEPILINAPMQGVIKSFSVNPGDHVVTGQLLLTIDKTDLQSAAEVSKKDYLLTESKLRTAINQGFDDKQSRSEIPILEAQLAIDKAHLDYANALLSKADVVSPISGIVVLDSKEDWVGQPVKTGERILVIADPHLVQLKIVLPVTNSLKLDVGAAGDLFLYGQLGSIPFKIKTLGYNAKLMPNKLLAYQLEADFNHLKEVPQLGAQGTVKIYGHYVPLIYYILRRPLQAFRQTFGI